MPFKPADAPRHTKKAKGKKKKKQFAAVANSVMSRGGSEGSAIRQANAVVGGTARSRPSFSTPGMKKYAEKRNR